MRLPSGSTMKDLLPPRLSDDKTIHCEIETGQAAESDAIPLRLSTWKEGAIGRDAMQASFFTWAIELPALEIAARLRFDKASVIDLLARELNYLAILACPRKLPKFRIRTHDPKWGRA